MNEFFFFRMLLSIVPGGTCFEDLKLYGETLHGPFKEACQACWLVFNDECLFYFMKQFSGNLISNLGICLSHLQFYGVSNGPEVT
jgi:hypothetical protein